MTLFVKPANPQVRVKRDHTSPFYIDPKGEAVPDTIYIRRRIQSGSLVIAAPPVVHAAKADKPKKES